VPTQGQTNTHKTGMQLTGLPAEQVRVHTTFLGGGFGRRSEQDFVTDAIETSKAVGAPVKVMWTREDDIQHDYYRPATYNRLTAVLDDKGMPIAWRHRIAGPSISTRDAKGREDSGKDFSTTEVALNLPYAIPNLQVSYARVNTAVPVGYWRSVSSSQNAYITECFLDELAAAGGKDPYQLRRELLRDQPRHRGVLELAASKAGWDTPLPAGRFRGIAVAASFASFAAQVAEISIDRGRVRVHRVVCAIDCGMIVNPDIIAAQMESGIIYGLTAALKGEISIAQGRAQQSNFNDYPLLTLEECPEIEVHIIPSTADPGGVGEPGTPPIAPAVANAVFAATGKPVRRLPIRLA
jgi:isoquinoline 1-oxidoreductase beta subunit